MANPDNKDNTAGSLVNRDSTASNNPANSSLVNRKRVVSVSTTMSRMTRKATVSVALLSFSSFLL